MKWLHWITAGVLFFAVFFTACKKKPTDTPEPGIGTTTLIIASQPSGATIWIDGVATETTTPDTLSDAEEGSYTVRLLLTDHFPWEAAIEVVSGETTKVSVTMEQVPPFKVAYSEHDTIWVVGLDGLNPVKFAENFSGTRLLWSPDGKFLSYSKNGGGIIILNEDGSLKTELPFGSGDRATDFTWSHNSLIQVNGSYTEGIYAYDTVADTLRLIRATSGFTYDHNPAFSPDNSLIAYVHHEYGSMAWIKLMNADGNNPYTVVGYFGTSYDEWLDLVWISNNETLFKAGLGGLYHLNMGFPPDTVAILTLVYFERVNKLRVSPDRNYYAIISHGLQWGTMNNWKPTQIMSYSSVDMAWSPNSDAIAYRTGYEVHWRKLDETDYRIINFPSYAGSGCISVAP